MSSPFESSTDPRPAALDLKAVVAHNQIYRLPFNSQNMLAQRDFPDGQRFAEHRSKVEKLMGASADFSPENWFGLDPERLYLSGGGGGFHGGTLMAWTLADKGDYVADVTTLIDDLSRDEHEGMSTVIPGAVFHSHWRRVIGPAADFVLLVNEGAQAGDRTILSSQIAKGLSKRGVDAEYYTTWLKNIHNVLAGPGSGR